MASPKRKIIEGKHPCFAYHLRWCIDAPLWVRHEFVEDENSPRQQAVMAHLTATYKEMYQDASTTGKPKKDVSTTDINFYDDHITEEELMAIVNVEQGATMLI